MQKRKTEKSAGFGAVEIIIAVVVVLIVGFIGWKLYDASKSKQNASTQHNSGSQANDQTSNTTPADTATYLDIKELGVKVKLSDAIKDATYYYDAAYNAQYPNPKQVTISSKSLADKSGGSCAASSGMGPLGTIQKYSGDVDGAGRPLVADGKTVFKVGDSYVALRTPQAACSSDSSILDLASTQRAAFTESFKSVQLDQ